MHTNSAIHWNETNMLKLFKKNKYRITSSALIVLKKTYVKWQTFTPNCVWNADIFNKERLFRLFLHFPSKLIRSIKTSGINIQKFGTSFLKSYHDIYLTHNFYKVTLMLRKTIAKFVNFCKRYEKKFLFLDNESIFIHNDICPCLLLYIFV